MKPFISIAQDTKIAVVTATATTTTGVSTWFQWIPSDIGLFASLLGGILTSVLIVTHAYKLYKEIKQDLSKKDDQK